MIYVMDVENPDAARRAYANSKMPIDLQHREVMATGGEGEPQSPYWVPPRAIE